MRTSDHHGLAGENVAPREHRAHPAADKRACGGRRSCNSAQHAVRENALLALVRGCREGRDSRDHECRAEALDDRPANEQHREIWRDGRDERADAVDHEADGKGAFRSPSVPKLSAEQHEGRHHERVNRDGGLKANHGGVEILHHLGDGHVHHRGVEHHDELGGREHDHHGPAGLLYVLAHVLNGTTWGRYEYSPTSKISSATAP